MEDGRFSGTCGSGAHSRAFEKTRLRLRHHSHIPPVPFSYSLASPPRWRLTAGLARRAHWLPHRRVWTDSGSAAADAGRPRAGVRLLVGRLLGGWSRHLGVCWGIQYGRAAMRVNWQQQGTRVSLVLAIVLVSLWTGSLTAPSAGTPADYLATSRPRPGLQPTTLPDSAPALRPAAERPVPQGRLVPLLAALAAALAGVYRGRAAARRRGLAHAGSRVWSTPLQARAPPRLQPA